MLPPQFLLPLFALSLHSRLTDALPGMVNIGLPLFSFCVMGV
jgi:hypothetical protein